MFREITPVLISPDAWNSAVFTISITKSQSCHSQRKFLPQETLETPCFFWGHFRAQFPRLLRAQKVKEALTSPSRYTLQSRDKARVFHKIRTSTLWKQAPTLRTQLQAVFSHKHGWISIPEGEAFDRFSVAWHEHLDEILHWTSSEGKKSRCPMWSDVRSHLRSCPLHPPRWPLSRHLPQSLLPQF